MRTALDTNVLSHLWSRQAGAERVALTLESCAAEGSLVVCAVVFCELRAHPTMSEDDIRTYLTQRSIAIDCKLQPAVWEAAAEAFADYAARRRRSRVATSGRLLADFLIGAHAMHNADRLMTMDLHRYRTYFPGLPLVGLEPV